MEIFYSSDIKGNRCYFDIEESIHLVRVMRHRVGDVISVIDGEGTLYKCSLIDDSSKGAEALIVGKTENWGTHNYNLTMAVCPTKNTERYEWFAEKATEIGLDRIVPVIGDRSERKVYKIDRLEKIILSAVKQSLKGVLPTVDDPVSVKTLISYYRDDNESLKLIAYCFDDEDKRMSVKGALDLYAGKSIVVLIGPEGDFSPEEVEYAKQCGFLPIHLGPSRLRTETAAVTAAEAVYFRYCL